MEAMMWILAALGFVALLVFLVVKLIMLTMKALKKKPEAKPINTAAPPPELEARKQVTEAKTELPLERTQQTAKEAVVIQPQPTPEITPKTEATAQALKEKEKNSQKIDLVELVSGLDLSEEALMAELDDLILIEDKGMVRDFIREHKDMGIPLPDTVYAKAKAFLNNKKWLTDEEYQEKQRKAEANPKIATQGNIEKADLSSSALTESSLAYLIKQRNNLRSRVSKAKKKPDQPLKLKTLQKELQLIEQRIDFLSQVPQSSTSLTPSDPVIEETTTLQALIEEPISAEQLLKQKTFIAIDFETANETRTSACSLGYTIVINGKIVKSDSFLIRPKDLRVNPINQSIHGISEADLTDVPEFDSFWPEIKQLLKNNLIVAHNCAFDIDVLKKTALLYNLELPDFQYLCSFKLSQEAFTDLQSHKLNDIAKHLAIPLNHHNSKSDAEACALITIKALSSGLDFGFDFSEQELTRHIKKKKSGSPAIDRTRAKLMGDILKPNLDVENKDNPFYKKVVVFTGKLESMERPEAAAKVHALGANINTSISKTTNYVVAGERMGPSKLKKILELEKQGIPIKMLSEDEFLAMVN